MQKIFKTSGVCSKQITFEVVDNTVKNVSFLGGCHGNAQGISALVEGRQVNELIDKLENITCGGKDTSCPAQLATALKAL
jgi:uncharacterized protein (TIGR03905 family)